MFISKIHLFHWKNSDSYSFSLRSSHVRIFFNHHEVVTLRRSETYTFANFMAICGGLLGLFLGVSTLSIIEFIYFSTLRMYWSFQEWKPKNIVAPFKRRPIKHITFDVPNVWIWKIAVEYFVLEFWFEFFLKKITALFSHFFYTFSIALNSFVWIKTISQKVCV